MPEGDTRVDDQPAEQENNATERPKERMGTSDDESGNKQNIEETEEPKTGEENEITEEKSRIMRDTEKPVKRELYVLLHWDETVLNGTTIRESQTTKLWTPQTSTC
jgi:hypothetical protein